MEILDLNQLAILQATRAGVWVGAVPFDKLQADVKLMLALRLIEPTGQCPYRLTPAGAKVLEVDRRHRAGEVPGGPAL
jgi:hypothetical protein